MEIKVEIPEYDPNTGIKYNWEPGFDIETKYEEGTVIFMANKAGLISLAKHLLNLAQDEIPLSYHLHFNENNSLNEGSVELIVQKK